MKNLKEIGVLENKKVLLRVDFNAVEGDEITGKFRIESHKKTIDYLLDQGARVCLVSHISKDGSFDRVYEKVAEILGKEIYFTGDFNIQKVSEALDQYSLVLVDNIRNDGREKENDMDFAKELAEPFDLYVNDAFSASHRRHASINAVAKVLPAYAGFMVEKEIEELSKAFDGYKRKVVIIGGAKTATKTKVINDFLESADSVLIGGAVSIIMFKAKGFDVGASLIDEDALKLAESIDLNNPKLVLPTDIVIAENKDEQGRPFPAGDIDKTHLIFDIGPETADYFSELIHHADLVIWNGAMGIFEREQFSSGTRVVAEAVANSEGYSIVGGGDSIAFFEENNLMNEYNFISTGGGAMLEFLARRPMPGLEVLE